MVERVGFGLYDLVQPVRTLQIGDGVPWNEWEASMLGAASQFRSYDVVSAAQRALDSYASIYSRVVEDRKPTKSELVDYLYQVCERYQIDKTVAYSQISQESAFNPDATGSYCVLGINNRKCALGIAQFIPSTAKSYGLADRLKPFDSFDAYGAYMRDLLSTFGNDYMKALAAYNAGPGAVQRAIERNGEGWLAAMPGETQAYVVRILGERAISDPTVLQSAQAAAGKPARIGVMDILFSDLGPDLLKRWALFSAAMILLAIALIPPALRLYRKVRP